MRCNAILLRNPANHSVVFLPRLPRQIDKSYPRDISALLFAGPLPQPRACLPFHEETSCPMLIRLSKICHSIQRR